MRAARRGIAALVALAAVVLVALAAGAFACANLATLNLSTPAATPGADVTATGSLVASPLVLHWDGPHGLVLAQAEPDGNRRISAAFTVPEGQVGPHRVVATGVGPDGVDSHVPAAAAPIELRAPVASAAGSATGVAPGAGWPVVAVAIAGALGLGLLVAGATRVRRHPAVAAVPAPGRAERR